MKQMPQIQKVMTPMPHSARIDLPLKDALSLMRENGIRHLPVQDGSRLVGVVTDRDVKLVSGFASAGELTVEEAMTPDPYTVGPETALDHVVYEMAEKKFGCVIIQQSNGKVVGIFTAVDAMRVLGDTLTQYYKQSTEPVILQGRI